MTTEDFRRAANAALVEAQQAIENMPNLKPALNPATFSAVIIQPPIQQLETNMSPRIEVMQNLEKETLNVLSLLSNAVSAMQAYQTAVMSPAGLGDNAPNNKSRNKN